MADHSASHGPTTGKSPLRVVIPNDVNATVEELLGELTQVLTALRTCHRALAETPDPGGPREKEISILLEKRETLGARIGTEIVRVLAAGGAVHVEGPLPPDAPLRPTAVAETPFASPPPRSSAADAALPLAGSRSAESLAEPSATPEPAPTAEVAPAPAVEAPVAEPGPVDDAAARPPEPRVEKEPTRTSRPALTARPPASIAVSEPAPVPRPRKGRSLRETLDLLGAPERIEHEHQAAAAVGRLVDACSDLDEWLAHPTEVQRALVGLTSSMARHVQDESDCLDRVSMRALGTWFSTMTRWSGLYKPGFVRGLSRMNRPERPTWLADWNAWWELLTERVTLDGDGRTARFDLMSAVFAESGLASTPPPPAPPPRTTTPITAVPMPEQPSEGVALRELEVTLGKADGDLDGALKKVLDAGVGQKDPRLVALLADHRERVASLRGLKTLKSALKFAKTPGRSDPPEAVSEPTVSTTALPESWPFYALTRGVNAVVVGGDPRPTERMREAFGFASVTWDPIDPRRVDALSARIRANSVEFVVLLRDFVSHSVADAVISACKDAKLPYVVVDAGYGVGQVRLAIERYLQGRVAQLQG